MQQKKIQLTDSKTISKVVKAIADNNHPSDGRNRAGDIVAVVMSTIALTPRVGLHLGITVLMNLVVGVIGKFTYICAAFKKSEHLRKVTVLSTIWYDHFCS